MIPDQTSHMVHRLLRFLDVDDDTKAMAETLSRLLTPHLDGIIDHFYERVQDMRISVHITDEVVARLKTKQKQHWAALFASRFGPDYINGTTQIGIRHRDIDLNPMWYIAGYMKLKLAFIEVIIRSDLPAVTKGHLVKVLDKYVAIDMALALSSYDAAVLD